MIPPQIWSAKSVVNLITVILTGVIVLSALVAIFPAQSQFESLVTGVAGFHGMIIVCVALFLQKQKVQWSEAFGLNNGRLGRVYAIGTLTGALLTLPVLILNALISLALARMGVSGELFAPGPPLVNVHFWFAGVMIVFGSSLAEELLFRGIIFPAICQIGYPTAGLWISSILYAAANLSLQRFAPLLLLGFVCGVLYKKFGNLWAPIFAHCGFNAVNFALLVFQR
jgi:membrane protease YdiL (CAAX protease family)